MGSLYRSRHELVFVLRSGSERHRNNVQLGRFGRNRTNVWNYPGANSFTEAQARERERLVPELIARDEQHLTRLPQRRGFRIGRGYTRMVADKNCLEIGRLKNAFSFGSA
jgi:hypothetical protein